MTLSVNIGSNLQVASCSLSWGASDIIPDLRNNCKPTIWYIELKPVASEDQTVNASMAAQTRRICQEDASVLAGCLSTLPPQSCHTGNIVRWGQSSRTKIFKYQQQEKPHAALPAGDAVLRTSSKTFPGTCFAFSTMQVRRPVL